MANFVNRRYGRTSPPNGTIAESFAISDAYSAVYLGAVNGSQFLGDVSRIWTYNGAVFDPDLGYEVGGDWGESSDSSFQDSTNNIGAPSYGNNGYDAISGQPNNGNTAFIHRVMGSFTAPRNGNLVLIVFSNAFVDDVDLDFYLRTPKWTSGSHPSFDYDGTFWGTYTLPISGRIAVPMGSVISGQTYTVEVGLNGDEDHVFDFQPSTDFPVAPGFTFGAGSMGVYVTR